MSAPVQRSLRGVFRDALELEGDRIVDAIFDDLAGLTDEQIGERTGLDHAQLSRIRAKKAHPPGRLIAFAIDQGRERHTLNTICDIGEGEFKPRPPPSVEDRYAATWDELAEMGLDEVLRQRVTRRLHGKSVTTR